MTSALRTRLVDRFRWTDTGDVLVSDRSGWWRDPVVLDTVGAALAEPFRSARPTVVVAPEVTGFLLGPLVARALGVGFVEAYRRGARRPLAEPVTWVEVPADHRGEPRSLGVRTGLLTPADRVLVVDDWVATGAQARALRDLAAVCGAVHLGTAAVVSEATPAVAAELGVRALLGAADLDAAAVRPAGG